MIGARISEYSLDLSIYFLRRSEDELGAVTPPPLLEFVWISLNYFDTWYHLCDITLGTVRIRSTQDQ
jgi:hypothetical protein